jgi:hypothetical protein
MLGEIGLYDFEAVDCESAGMVDERSTNDEIVWHQDSTVCKRHAHQHHSPSSPNIRGDCISPY